MRPTWDSCGYHRSLFGLGPHGTIVSFRTRNLSIAASLYNLAWISFLFWSQPSLIASHDAVVFRVDRGVSSEELRDPRTCSYQKTLEHFQS